MVIKAKQMRSMMHHEMQRIQAEHDPSKVREVLGFIACMNLFNDFYGDLLNTPHDEQQEKV